MPLTTVTYNVLPCQQEVELALFTALDAALRTWGHRGQSEPKGRGRPDGCATFFRAEALAPVHYHRREHAEADTAGDALADGDVLPLG